MFDRLMRVSADRYQAMEAVLFDLLTKRSIGAAVGQQLDGIGDIMGLARVDITPRIIVNLLAWTEEFENWSKSAGVSVDTNTDIAPDGTTSVDTITFPNPGSGDYDNIYQGTPSLIGGNNYSYSVWLAGTGTLHLDGNTYTGNRQIDLTTEITRYDVPVSPDIGGSGSWQARLISYPGDTATSFKVWGAMMNPGTSPDIYVRNGGGIVPVPVVDMSDTSYRYALLSQFLSMTKSGSVEDVINAYKIVMGAAGVEYEEIYPAMFQLAAAPEVDTTDPVVANFITQTMRRMKPAGVSMILSTSGGFTLSQASEADADGNGPESATEGFGSSIGGETDGGGLSRVI